jgi:hypothetical protein
MFDVARGAARRPLADESRAIDRSASPSANGAVRAKPAEPEPSDRFTRLARLTPADAMVVYFGRPVDGTGDAGAVAQSNWTTMLGAVGALAGGGAAFADVLATLPLLAEMPHAIVLADLDVEPFGEGESGSIQVSGVQAAAILRTGRHRDAVLAHVNRLVQRYTNSDVGKLEKRRAGEDEYVRLEDDRLPSWAVFEWGGLDEYYVVAVGRGTFERIASCRRGKSAALADADWFKKAHQAAGGPKALVELVVDFAQLHGGLTRVAESRVDQVFQALGIAGLSQELWTIGESGRALTCHRARRRGDRIELMAYSDPRQARRGVVDRVPPGATRYAILYGATSWLFDRVPLAWSRAVWFKHRGKVEVFWNDMQKELKIDVQRDLLERLGDDVVICNYPPHPAGVPIALTIAVEVNDADAVRRTSDALLGALKAHLESRRDGDASDLFKASLQHSPDGVWYIQMGILGPAACVTDGWIVISWSPRAVRDVRPFFSRAGGAAASRKAD